MEMLEIRVGRFPFEIGLHPIAGGDCFVCMFQSYIHERPNSGTDSISALAWGTRHNDI
jgi:hypothetical protein